MAGAKSSRKKRKVNVSAMSLDDSDIEMDPDIPRTRNVGLSRDGKRIIQTFHSPSKRFALDPRPESIRAPAALIQFEDEKLEALFPFAQEETVDALVAAKRYPVSVCTSSILFRFLN